MGRNLTEIDRIIAVLRKESKKWNVPIVTAISESERRCGFSARGARLPAVGQGSTFGGETRPYKVLIATILSLRTKDETTAKASERLFQMADTPEAMAQLKPKQIEKLIFPVGFYHTKAKWLIDISKRLIDEYTGRVPDEIDELLKLKGVGRKTANLVVTLGYGKLGICVDTHVHRISNRLGIVKTKTPEKTEFALREILPKKYWIEYNDLLVAFGQSICHPTSPWCSKCPIEPDCPRLNVARSR